MQQIILNQFEKIASDDIDNLQLAIYQAIQDDVLYNFFGQQNGVIGGGFACTYVSAYVAHLAAGVGFFYNSSATGFNPLYEEIVSESVIVANFTTADPSHNRIDLVCLAPNFSVTATANRYVKTGGTGPVTLTEVNKLSADGYTLQVVAGTPGVSPTPPALPTGYIEIAQVLITAATGMTGSGAITDERTVLSIAASNVNHAVATGTSVQTQLDELDNAQRKTATINPSAQSPYTLSTTILTGDNGKMFLVESANGPMTFDLPAPVNDFFFTIVDVSGNLDTNPCTMHRYSTEEFEGLAADYEFQAPWGRWIVWCDGTNWWIGA